MLSHQENQPLTWTMRFARLFLDNAALTLLALIALVIGGLFSLTQLQVQGFPTINIGMAVVNTVLPGGTASDIEDQVTNPIEGSIKDVAHIKEINSSSQPNVSTISVMFEEGVDINSPLTELRGKVASVKLPDGTQKPEVFVPEVTSPLYTVALTKPNATQAELLDAGQKFEESLLAIPEVSKVDALTPNSEQLVVKLDPDKLGQTGISAQQLTQVLGTASINLPAGNAALSSVMQPIVTDGQITSLDQLRDTIIGVSPGAIPRPIKLSDVATVSQNVDTKGKIEHIAYRDGNGFNRQPGVQYAVRLRDGENLLKVDPKLRSEIDKLNNDQTLGQGVKVVMLSSQADMSRAQIKEILAGAVGEKLGGSLGWLGYLFGGIWLLCLALLLFLNWRIALIGALAIPLSFLFTFLSLLFLHTQLNTIVLFSFILVLGLIVDPAIVVLEAMQRFRDHGLSSKEAVLRATHTIGGGLFIAVLTSIVVFVPFGIISGIFGEIVKYIPLTVIPALIASYIVPMVFLTWLGQKWLKPQKIHKSEDEVDELWAFSRVLVRFNRFILARRYLQILVLLLGLALPIGVAGAMFASGKISMVQFSQPTDAEALMVSARFPRSRTEADKAAINNDLEAALEPETAVTNAYIYDQSTPTNMIWYVTLTKPAEREETSGQILERIKGRLNREKLADFTLSQASVGTPQADYPIQIQLFDQDLAKLKKAAIETGKVARGIEGITEVDDGFTGERNPETHIVVDRDKAQAQGLSPALVGSQLRLLYGEEALGRIFDPARARTVDFVLKATDEAKADTQSDLGNILISKPTGGTVKLADVASVQEQTAVESIGHSGGRRFVQIRAKVADAKQAAVLQQQIVKTWTPEKLAEYGLRSSAIENRGDFDQIAKSFTELGYALIAAIFLTYAVLVLFFRSFAQPLIILFAIPLTFIGVFPALAYLSGGQLGFLEMLGIITLIGIVENVGIFVIDEANQLVKKGSSRKEAISRATGIRFRPIFLTKVTALGGLLPLAVLSPFWRGLSVVIIAGILVSGILSLFTTPVLYSWFTTPIRQWSFRKR